jgi:uncharacterized protein YozE (UPF0346 family)
MFSLFKKKQKQKLSQIKNESNNETIDQKIELARKIVEEIIAPKLEKDLDIINERLKKNHKVHIGIKIDWFFQKLD